MKNQERDYNGIEGIVSNIETGNFSQAAACLRVGGAGGEVCSSLFSKKSEENYRKISYLEIFNGRYIDRSAEFIDEFKEKVVKSSSEPVGNFSFDFKYNLISPNDINSWSYFNQSINKRIGYFSAGGENSIDKKSIYINGGGVFEPVIFFSNTKPVQGGRVRVLAISDSHGTGAGLESVDDSWAKELEFQLNQIEDRYEVITLAQGGAGYNEYLNWVEEGYIEAIDPDIVLFSYFKNDFYMISNFAPNANGESNSEGINFSRLDAQLGFYLRCFEKEDDLLGRGLKRAMKFLPNIYRFYKFSSCSEELATYDNKTNIDVSEVIESFKKIDTLIKVPTYLYQIESNLGLDRGNQQLAALDAINKNGITFINKSDNGESSKIMGCDNTFIQGHSNCKEFYANLYDKHFNRHYYKKHLEIHIKEIKNRIDSSITLRAGNERYFSGNRGGAIISDYLPSSLFIFNKSDKAAEIGFFDGTKIGLERLSRNFCVPFDRKGVVINFNRYLTEGREIRVSSKFQKEGLALVSRGYDSEGRVIYGEAIELRAGSSVSFSGGESVRGLIVLGNNKDCSSKEIDSSEEFLLEVEVL